jgi:hypothetical protein
MRAPLHNQTSPRTTSHISPQRALNTQRFYLCGKTSNRLGERHHLLGNHPKSRIDNF